MSEPAEKSSETGEAAQSTDKVKSIEEVDQLMSLNKEKVNVAALTELGSKYMLPTEIGTLISNLSSIKYTTDPFIELYYFYKTMEQNDASFKQNTGNPFFDYRTKEAIASRNELRRIAFLNSFDSKTLGVTEYRDFRKQAKQLEFEILSLDEDESSKELHIRLLSQIESGYSDILKIERCHLRLDNSTNSFAQAFLKHDIEEAHHHLLKAFSIDRSSTGQLSVKPKGLLRVLSYQKGKKLLLAAAPFFTKEVWKCLLSILIPYLLIWTGDEAQREVTDRVLRTIQSYLESEQADLSFLTAVLNSFIQQKTYPCFYDAIIPVLLQSEKYAGLIIALLSRGEKIANGSEGDAGESCSQELAEEWKGVVSVLNAKLAKQSMWTVCWNYFFHLILFVIMNPHLKALETDIS